MAATLVALAAPALAVDTKVIRDDTFDEFRQGESTGTEILAEGRLQVAPEVKRLHLTDEAVGWGAVVDRKDGGIFFCTGNNGKVFRWTPDGKTELWADLAEVQAMAIAIDATGGVLVGAAPGGKIYRIVEANKPQLFFETGEQYIWDMILDRNGLLYAATGPNGRIFRIRGERNGEVMFDSDATNVLDLDFTPDGRLLAATQGKGMVLRVDKPNDAYVLHASPDDECRSLALDSSGNIYVAVNGFRPGGGGPQTAMQSAEGARAAAQAVQSMAIAGFTQSDRALAGIALPVPQGAMAAKSRVVRIEPSGFVSDFWEAPEGPVRAMLTDTSSNSILVAAGDSGRIYRLRTDSRYSKLADVPEPMITALMEHEGRIFLTTGNKAGLYELTNSPRAEGLFESRALNAGSTVRWGNIRVGSDPHGAVARVKVSTRSGNTPDPAQASWSDWADTTEVAPGIVKVESPVSQYLQYRLKIDGNLTAGQTLVDAVSTYYVERNAAPVFKSVVAEKAGSSPAGRASTPARRPATPTPPSSTSSQSDSSDPIAAIARAAAAARVTPDSRRPAESSDKADGEEVAASPNQRRLEVKWEVKDPNDDKMKYELQFKADDETKWRTIDDNITDTKFTVPTDFVGDGTYRFRVIASDEISNPADEATSASAESQAVQIDNTPPVITIADAKKVGPGEYEVRIEAEDATSLISSAEYVVDVEDNARIAFPEDGLFDLQKETFVLRFKVEKPEAAHVLTFRVFDSEGNSAVARTELP